MDENRFSRKSEHWQNKIIASCEQCGQNLLPTIQDPISVSKWLTTTNTQGNAYEQIKILFSPRSNTSLRELKSKINEFPKNNNDSNDVNNKNKVDDILKQENDEKQKILVAIGAESGFSAKEESLFISNGFICVGLGPRILRTETAAIVGLSLIQYLFGDLD
jgi:16S rRNA (uracil1498-N3)-methyltransferase